VTAPGSARPFPMNKIPVALQLYSVREETAKDFARTVAEVARMGYRGVELAGTGNLDAARAKAALDKAGLIVAGMHTGIDALRRNFNEVVADAHLFGTRDVVCSWLPPALYVSAAAAERIGEEFNSIGSALRAFGLRLSFHNHASEFKLFDGKPVLRWMLEAAEPRNLGAQVDVYWAHVGGYAPERILRDLGSRSPLIHLKDAKEIGSGPVDFKAIFGALDSIGTTEWCIVEQEWYNHPPMEGVRLCLEKLKEWQRV
jgi:sugar phosphate isomerase/epimerase